MRKGNGGIKKAVKIVKKGMANKPEKGISQIKCKNGCVYFEKDLANNFGDWITSFAGIKEIPKADANSSE